MKAYEVCEHCPVRTSPGCIHKGQKAHSSTIYERRRDDDQMCHKNHQKMETPLGESWQVGSSCDVHCCQTKGKNGPDDSRLSVSLYPSATSEPDAHILGFSSTLDPSGTSGDRAYEMWGHASATRAPSPSLSLKKLDPRGACLCGTMTFQAQTQDPIRPPRLAKTLLRSCTTRVHLLDGNTLPWSS